jgi:hypothetical protein
MRYRSIRETVDYIYTSSVSRQPEKKSSSGVIYTWRHRISKHIYLEEIDSCSVLEVSYGDINIRQLIHGIMIYKQTELSIDSDKLSNLQDNIASNTSIL